MRSFIMMALALSPAIAFADSCDITVSSGDTMTFSTRSISVPASCQEFTVNFEHQGHMPKTGMGHNWVLSKSADVGDLAKHGAHAGADNNFLPPDDKRVIAATSIIGGGEKTSVTFKTSALSKDEAYTYFCSYPGHFSMMRGTLKLED